MSLKDQRNKIINAIQKGTQLYAAADFVIVFRKHDKFELLIEHKDGSTAKATAPVHEIDFDELVWIDLLDEVIENASN